MKNTFFYFLMSIAFVCFSQSANAQELAEAKEDIKNELTEKKDEIIKKYAWTKDHFENKDLEIISVNEYNVNGGVEFVLIETKEATVMYDANGKVYCTDRSDLDCQEFYKLTPSGLSWARS